MSKASVVVCAVGGVFRVGVNAVVGVSVVAAPASGVVAAQADCAILSAKLVLSCLKLRRVAHLVPSLCFLTNVSIAHIDQKANRWLCNVGFSESFASGGGMSFPTSSCVLFCVEVGAPDACAVMPDSAGTFPRPVAVLASVRFAVVVEGWFAGGHWTCSSGVVAGLWLGDVDHAVGIRNDLRVHLGDQ